MLIYHRTSLMVSRAQTVVNTVNCVGVMGKGIAAEFKARYPAMFSAYKGICDAGQLEPGKLWLWQGADQWVLNFPTKRHWRYPSKLEWVEAGLEKFVHEYEARGISEISFPRLGCGNGNLDWKDVKPLMERYLGDLRIPVFVHDFSVDIGLPEHLELVIDQLPAVPPVNSFESFIESISRALTVSKGRLVDIETNEPFHASLNDEGLQIDFGFELFLVEMEDLKGLWMMLRRGLVTKEHATWAAGEGAEQIITLLTLLPGTRAVQIQQSQRPPELAIEMKHPAGSQNVAGGNKGQPEFAWA